jgi:crotonobetainyl-CoA:carnitine CoA-transferase CaiB-like acyl-CoA transferase
MLEQMRVLSFSHWLQGPAASQYLGDMGADVIKVEPLDGAFERRFSPAGAYVDGHSSGLLAANRNKRSIAIDLKHPKAKRIIHRLVETIDVVTENYRVGVLDRLGFGFKDLQRTKPNLIYASATGWGVHGPMVQEPGQDLLAQARTGLIAATGDLATLPSSVGAAIVDQHGGALLALGILAAYVKRLATGEGTRVESSLLTSAIDLQAETLTHFFARGATRANIERDPHIGLWFSDAPYGVYRLCDAHIAVSAGGKFEELPRLLGIPELAELGPDGRKTRRNEYAKLFAAKLETMTFDKVAAVLTSQGIWFSRVQSYDDLPDDPQIAAIGALTRVPVGEAQATLVTHPIRYDGEVRPVRHLPLALGDSTRAVLQEAGYTEDEIAALAAEKAIGVADPN